MSTLEGLRYVIGSYFRPGIVVVRPNSKRAWRRIVVQGVYCYDFQLLPITSYCFMLLGSCLLLVCGRSNHTPRHKLPLPPTVSRSHQPV